MNYRGPSKTGTAAGPPAIEHADLYYRSHHRRRWFATVTTTILILLIAIGTFFAPYLQHRTNTARGLDGNQLLGRLPTSKQLPATWTYSNTASSHNGYLLGLGPADPPRQCDFLGAFNAESILISLRTGTAFAVKFYTQKLNNSYIPGAESGDLSLGYIAFNPGGAASAMKTIDSYMQACPSWADTTLNVSYTLRITSIPNLGTQNFDIHIVPSDTSLGYRTELVIVRVDNRLAIVSCTAQPFGSIPNLSRLARELVSRV